MSPVRVARGPRPLPPAVVLLLATSVALPLGILIEEPVIRAALVLPLALLVPGYGVLVASFGPWLRLDPAPAASLSVALSASLYPLLALVLYAVGIDLSRPGVLAATDVFLVGLAIVITVRARREGVAEGVWVPARAPSASSPVTSPWSRLGAGVLLLCAVATVIAALAAVVPRLPAPATEPYTQFALRGRWAAVNTVVRAQAGRVLRVEVAVVNRTDERRRYRVVPRLPGGRGWAARAVTLAPGERWAGSVDGTVPRRGCLHRLVLALDAVDGDQAADGMLTLWVRSSGVPPTRCPPS